MKAALPLAAILLLTVSACDKPKPRPAAVAAAAAAAAGAPTVMPPASAGLAKRPEMAVFTLDMINGAQDPLNIPATIQSGQPTTFSGFGFDPVARTAGKAIDIVIDGVAYGTNYGGERQDVAAYYKTGAVTPSGFRVTLPAGIVKPGPHKMEIRVVAADGKAFHDSATLSFYAK
ncbi:MAG: hypothetical protein EPO51_14500 [Phenylobacterium sp.]|uniref:hypothetical protein n=1 Tax=Phenylobacterium sp. TaxID=1871053 RepID=UPI00121DEEF6|nr:hypothetical protein [Phenylobacterium sp.]TAJ71489.1 MAG: hypothetical protein EPO51_14500 [Phenylobacterium sp.]